jgi:hypothetical protein
MCASAHRSLAARWMLTHPARTIKKGMIMPNTTRATVLSADEDLAHLTGGHFSIVVIAALGIACAQLASVVAMLMHL